MAGTYCEILRRHYGPLEPIPTGTVPVLKRLRGIRAVLFDLYGTLFISASGEVGTARAETIQNGATQSGIGQHQNTMQGPASTPQRALQDALCAVGIPAGPAAGEAVETLFDAIEASHAASRKTGIEYPEVDLTEIWHEVLAALVHRGLVEASACRAIDPGRLAVEYEARANACWPMPHLSECLKRLRDAGLKLGIISNAQFYTPELFEALLGKPAESWGFRADLQVYSYQHGRAKPGSALFELAAQTLENYGITPAEVLYVGNDMLNDILPACKLGFNKALFAGDARSLRWREGDERVAGIAPDLILTDLRQLVASIVPA